MLPLTARSRSTKAAIKPSFGQIHVYHHAALTLDCVVDEARTVTQSDCHNVALVFFVSDILGPVDQAIDGWVLELVANRGNVRDLEELQRQLVGCALEVGEIEPGRDDLAEDAPILGCVLGARVEGRWRTAPHRVRRLATLPTGRRSVAARAASGAAAAMEAAKVAAAATAARKRAVLVH
eukprot:scaffold53500_cov69-Phaeocystis_antarctica.AAC.1